MKDDFMHGFGIFTWPNGEKYEGQFSNDKLNGRGKFYWASGKYYEGEFKD